MFTHPAGQVLQAFHHGDGCRRTRVYVVALSADSLSPEEDEIYKAALLKKHEANLINVAHSLNATLCFPCNLRFSGLNETGTREQGGWNFV